MMRVLVLSDCPFIPNSLGKIVRYITAGFMDAGHEVINVCPAAYTTLDRRCVEYRWREYVFKCCPWSGSLKYYVDTFRPDTIFLFGTPYSPPLNEALQECYENRWHCVGYFDNESIWLIPEYGLHAANVVAFAAPTGFTLSTFIHSLTASGISYKVLEERTKIIYHGVDPDMYRGGERLLPWDKLVYGFFGKNHIRKNLGVLIDAYAQACITDKRFMEDTALYLAYIGFAGDNTWNIDLLLSLARLQYGIDISHNLYTLIDHEIRVGVPESSVAKIYKSIDVFVFPSEGEAFGLPPIEYLAGGEGPVIVSRHPALKEIWHDVLDVPLEFLVDGWDYAVGDALVLFHPDPKHLSEIMLRLYYEPDTRRALREKQEGALDYFTVRRMVSEMNGFLEESMNYREPLSLAGKQ